MPIVLDEYYKIYGKEKVDQAIALLNYKETTTMPKEEPADAPILYVFRHGQSEDNENYLFSGWRNPKLTQKGKAQAQILAPKLKDKKIDIIIASTQLRAIETMQIAMSLNSRSNNLEIHQDLRIRERSYGDLQGTSKLEMQLENPALLKEYRRSYTKRANNGENLDDVVRRVGDFCQEIVPIIKSSKLNVAISCHSNSMRGFRMFFEKLSPQEVCNLETPLGQDYIAYAIR